jgi:hypothetical protein
MKQILMRFHHSNIPYFLCAISMRNKLHGLRKPDKFSFKEYCICSPVYIWIVPLTETSTSTTDKPWRMLRILPQSPHEAALPLCWSSLTGPLNHWAIQLTSRTPHLRNGFYTLDQVGRGQEVPRTQHVAALEKQQTSWGNVTWEYTYHSSQTQEHERQIEECTDTCMWISVTSFMLWPLLPDKGTSNITLDRKLGEPQSQYGCGDE